RGSDFIIAILGSQLTVVSSQTDDADDPLISVAGDEYAYVALMQMPEYRILPNLSQTLGDRGIGGRGFPASPGIHYVGLRGARTLGLFSMTPPAAPRRA